MGQMKISGKTATEIFENVRRLTRSGQLAAGQTLPPVRELAARLEVNRNTVAAAYKQLVTAGIALTQGRRGTVIRPLAEMGEQEGTLPGSPLIDLAGGNPDPALLPDPLLALAASGYRPALYGEASVDPALEAVARTWFDPDCRTDYAVHVTHGAVDTIERLLAAYLVPGDKVAVEDPCFLSSINALRIAGLQPVAVATDAEGMQPEALAQALAQGAHAVLLTPRAQNPTGSNLTPARAQALRQVLADYPHALVIEDDHFALLARAVYHSVVPPTTQHWALIRSVSKSFGPDLRLALVACDGDSAQRLSQRLAPGTTWVSYLLQATVRALLECPEAMNQVSTAAALYEQRRSLLIAALRSEGISALQPCEGLNVWVPLDCDSQPVAHRLAQRGWLVRNGAVFAIDTPVQALRITASTLNAADAEKFAADLSRSLSFG